MKAIKPNIHTIPDITLLSLNTDAAILRQRIGILSKRLRDPGNRRKLAGCLRELGAVQYQIELNRG